MTSPHPHQGLPQPEGTSSLVPPQQDPHQVMPPAPPAWRTYATPKTCWGGGGNKIHKSIFYCSGHRSLPEQSCEAALTARELRAGAEVQVSMEYVPSKFSRGFVRGGDRGTLQTQSPSLLRGLSARRKG